MPRCRKNVDFKICEMQHIALFYGFVRLHCVRFAPEPGNPEHIPCYRVVNSKGELAAEFVFGGAGKQADMLEADGIVLENGRVNLKKYGINVEEMLAQRELEQN